MGQVGQSEFEAGTDGVRDERLANASAHRMLPSGPPPHPDSQPGGPHRAASGSHNEPGAALPVNRLGPSTAH